jgi:hypothetical protein
MLSVVPHLHRDKLRLRDEPNLTYAQMNSNQRKHMKRIYENPTSYDDILRSVDGVSLNFDGFRKTVSIDTIHLFEDKNSDNINVFMIDKEDLYPARITESNYNITIDLLLLEEIKDGHTHGHYVLIPALGKFVGKNAYKRMTMCKRCFTPISEANTKHDEICQARGNRLISVPKDEEFRFNKFQAHVDVCYKIIYNILEYSEPFKNYTDTSNFIYTDINEESTVSGYSLVVLDPEWNLVYQTYFAGGDAMEKLVEKIYEKGSECIQIVKDKYLPLKVSPALQRIRREAKLCQLCHKPLIH